MKKKMKRLIGIMMAGIMILSMAACQPSSGGSSSSSSEVKSSGQESEVSTGGAATAEPVTFRIFAGVNPMSPDNSEKALAKQFSEETGVTIEWECISTEMMTERKNLIFATNDLPDAFMNAGLTDYELTTYGADGVLLPLNDYMTEEYMPNMFKELINTRDYVLPICTLPDGNIYSLPRVTEMNFEYEGKSYGIGSIPQFTAINKDWLEKLNLEMPKTVDELHDVLTAFKTQDPNGNGVNDEIPLTLMYDHWCAGMGTFFAPFGFTDYATSNDNVAGNKHRALVDGKVVYQPIREEYKEAIAYYHNWFKEGLIDVEAFSQDASQYIAKGKSDDVTVGSFVWWEIPEVVGYDRAESYEYLPVLTNSNGDYYVNVNQQDNGVGRSSFSITSKCQQPERLLEWADQFYIPINSMQAIYGPIGEFFEKDPDENGVYMNKTPPEGTTEGELKALTEFVGPGIQLSEHYGTLYYMEDRAQLRLDETRDFWFQFVENPEYYPNNIVFTYDETEVENELLADIVNYTAEMSSNWLLNGGIEEQWDEYIAQLEKMGINDLIGAWQSAYDRYQANLE